ncbi:hypothetical protein Ancab_001682 [Ancistrocladus abbreviatus]
MAIHLKRFENSEAEQSSFNEDMSMEILLRLTAKSLAKFKSVSKHWNSLISSPHFSRLHILLHPTNSISRIFLRASSESNPNSFNYYCLSLSNNPVISPLSRAALPLPSTTAIRILQSCNGLLLCRSVADTIGPRDYYVYNPTIKDLKLLPSFPSGKPYPVLGVTLAFDPNRPGDYHVVCVGTSASLSGSHYRIIVYFSSSGCWKEWSGNDFYVPYEVVFSNGVYCKEAVHWIAAANRNDSLYFDVANERLGKMPTPPISTRSGFGTFSELEGKLCYIDSNADVLGHYYKVYAMESYNTGWSLKDNVQIDEVLRDLPKKVVDNYAEWILCLAREEANGRLIMVIHVPGKILAYDLEDKSCKKLCDVEQSEGNALGKLKFSGFDAYPYAPSLAFV